MWVSNQKYLGDVILLFEKHFFFASQCSPSTSLLGMFWQRVWLWNTLLCTPSPKFLLLSNSGRNRGKFSRFKWDLVQYCMRLGAHIPL